MKEAFETFDHEFHCTHQKDGEKAITYLQNTLTDSNLRMPDLILLDLNLPRKNGFEVLEFIKSHETLKIIPTVIFTTSSSQKDITACYKRHANCYITKPAEIESYLEVLKGVQYFWNSVAKKASKRE